MRSVKNLSSCLARIAIPILMASHAFATPTNQVCRGLFSVQSLGLEGKKLPESTLRMLRDEHIEASHVKRVVSTEDVEHSHHHLFGAERIIEPGRSVFLAVEGVGDVAIFENDPDSNEILRLSDVYGAAHEVWTVRVHMRDGSVISSGRYFHGDEKQINSHGEVSEEAKRILGELGKKHELGNILAIELLHSHPFFEVMFTGGEILIHPLSPADVTNGPEALIGHGIAFVTAVVPNGHRYTAALARPNSNIPFKNITRDLFE